MKKLLTVLVVSLLFVARPCWSTVFDYSVIGTFLDINQVPGTISGNVWIDDGDSVPTFENLTSMGNFTYNIVYFSLTFDSATIDFVETGTGYHLRIQFWTESNPNAGYRNFNDSFILSSDNGGLYGTANVLTNTGNYIDDFASIPTQFFFPDDGYGVFRGPEPGVAHMSVNLTQVSPVPEPSTLILLCSGLIGMVGCGKRLWANK